MPIRKTESLKTLFFRKVKRMSKGEKPNRDSTEDKNIKDPTEIVSFPLNFKTVIFMKREGTTITEEKTGTMIINQDKNTTKEIDKRESTITLKRLKK